MAPPGWGLAETGRALPAVASGPTGEVTLHAQFRAHSRTPLHPSLFGREHPPQRGAVRSAVPLTARPVALTSRPMPSTVLHAASAITAKASATGDQVRTSFRMSFSHNGPHLERVCAERDPGPVPFGADHSEA